jgi:hypothetical protein
MNAPAKKIKAFMPSFEPQDPPRGRTGMLCYAKILELNQGLRDSAANGAVET